MVVADRGIARGKEGGDEIKAYPRNHFGAIFH